MGQRAGRIPSVLVYNLLFISRRTMNMLQRILTCSCVLVAVFAAIVAVAGETKQAKPQIEVCFVLDTTGSMGGLIEGAKQKIWSIANEMISAKPTPEIRLGLVAYRDRGDQYITKLFDLTNDIDAVYANLQKLRADGGGDTPESVNQALNEAVTKLSWSQDRKVLKIIFLVGDSPPHMDYSDDVKYPDVCQAAMKRDLIINTVQCGNSPETTTIWKKISVLSEGHFVAIPQSGGMVAIATPMDSEISDLNRKLNGTLVAYGDIATRHSTEGKAAIAAEAPASVAADRSKFIIRSGGGMMGMGGGGGGGGGKSVPSKDLLDALADGTVKLESVKKDDLPENLQKLDAPALKAEIEKRKKARADLQAQLIKLSKERDDFLAKERKRLAEKGKVDSFDETVAQTIRDQAAKKGINYDK
jgi:Mg-chelatase subunit ChlD